MKILTIISALLLAPIVVLLQFADTAPFFSTKKIDLDYAMTSKDLKQQLGQLCSDDMRVFKVKYFADDYDGKMGGTFVKHVQYNSMAELIQMFLVCNELPVDVMYDNEYLVENLVNAENGKNVMIFGIPSFDHGPKINFKKENGDDEDVVEAFDKAKSLAAEEDGEATILDDGDNDDEDTPSNSSLFTTYQFFSSGIFMGLIVSFFLLFILYMALTWMTTIQISYKSFDKQVDHDKKTE